MHKSLTPTPKSEQVPQIAPIIPRTFLNFCPIILKTHKDIGQKIRKSALRYRRNLRTFDFLAFFTSNCSYNGTFAKGLIFLQFKNIVDYRAKSQ